MSSYFNALVAFAGTICFVFLQDQHCCRIFWSCLIAGVVIFFCLESATYHFRLGQPITLAKLRRKVFYTIRGFGEYQWGKKVVFINEYAYHPIIAVFMPVDLPKNASGFFVIQHRDKYGNAVRGVGKLVVSHENMPEERITFFWNPEKPPKKKK